MDREHWDDRYRTAELVWRADPNRWVVEEVAGLSPGRALDLACGEGRNAVWLAEQGWDVTGVDFSPVGLDKGRRMAAERRVQANWAEADDRSNLTDGTGGPQDPAVLYTPVDVVADLRLGGVPVEVQRAEVVRRPVDTATGPADALDALVRAVLPA